MIVKVMGVKPLEYQLWDGINHVEISPIEECMEGVVTHGPCKVMGSVLDENIPKKAGMAIYYYDKNGEWCVILFNTTAYICGDNGKTLEVVHG